MIWEGGTDLHSFLPSSLVSQWVAQFTSKESTGKSCLGGGETEAGCISEMEQSPSQCPQHCARISLKSPRMFSFPEPLQSLMLGLPQAEPWNQSHGILHWKSQMSVSTHVNNLSEVSQLLHLSPCLSAPSSEST